MIGRTSLEFTLGLKGGPTGFAQIVNRKQNHQHGENHTSSVPEEILRIRQPPRLEGETEEDDYAEDCG